MTRLKIALLTVLAISTSISSTAATAGAWIQGWGIVSLSGSLIVQVAAGEGPVHVSCHGRSGGAVQLLEPVVVAYGDRPAVHLWRCRKFLGAGEVAITIWSSAEAAAKALPEPPYSEAMLETTGWLSGARLMAGQAGPPTGSIDLVATTLVDDRGKVWMGLFNSKATFLKADKYFMGVAVPAIDRVAAHLFENVPYGDYTIGIFQDTDGDEKLDTSGFGVPVEPYGVSNDARGDGRAPRYEDARFRIRAPRVRMDIRVE